MQIWRFFNRCSIYLGFFIKNHFVYAHDEFKIIYLIVSFLIIHSVRSLKLIRLNHSEIIQQNTSLFCSAPSLTPTDDVDFLQILHLNWLCFSPLFRRRAKHSILLKTLQQKQQHRMSVLLQQVRHRDKTRDITKITNQNVCIQGTFSTYANSLYTLSNCILYWMFFLKCTYKLF